MVEPGPRWEPTWMPGDRRSLIAGRALDRRGPRERGRHTAERSARRHDRRSPDASLLIRPPAGIALAGRERELALLLEETRKQHGFVISGPTGIGRTRLVNEVAARLRAGHAVLLAGGSWRTPEDVSAAIATLGATAQTTDEPVLLIVDDAHLLDPGLVRSLTAVHEQGITLVLAVDTDSASASTVDDLGDELGLGRLELAGLDAVAAGEMLAGLAGFELDAASVLHLVRLTEGVPLALVDALHAAVRDGAVVAVDGGWQLRTPLRVPARWRRVAAVVDELSGAKRRALELVALAESVAPARLERLVAPEDLVGLERAGLLRARRAVPVDGVPTTDDLEVEVARPALRELVLQAVPVFRRRELLRELLGVFGTPELHTEQWLRIIAWRQEVGIGVDEATLLDAAKFAHDLRQPAVAMSLAGSAWRSHRSVESAVTLATVLHASARHEPAERLLAAAEACHGRQDTVLVCRARGYVMQGRLVDAAEVVAAVDAGGGELCRAIVTYHQGQIAVAHARFARLMASGIPAVRAEAAVYAAASLRRMGRPRTAVRALRFFYLEQSRTTARHTVSFPMLGTAVDVVAAELAAADGDLAGACEALADDSRTQAGWPRSSATAERWVARAAVLLDLGRAIDALAGYDTVTRWSGAWEITRQAAVRGHTVADAVVRGSAQQVPDRGSDAIGRAWRARAISGDAEVAGVLTESIEAAAACGAHGDVADAVHQMGRLGVADSARPWWHVPVEGPLLQARLDYSRAVATGDAELLSEVGRSFETVRADLYAAESFAELAVLHLRRGEPRAAAAASLRARQLAGSCQTASTPALLLLATGQPLSKREREIALLARNGFTDHEIAARLCLSVRTVQNHLYRVYHKWGINGRRALRGMRIGPAGSAAP